MHLIAVIDAFTKFVFLKAVRATNAKSVIHLFEEIASWCGRPKIIISDQGSAFTSKSFQRFCIEQGIKHVTNAVATPRANGQVERLNRTILSSLLTTSSEETTWDESVGKVQFAINNVNNKTTGKTPSELLFGYKPRGSTDQILVDEVSTFTAEYDNLLEIRRAASDKIEKSRKKMKERYDKKRKAPNQYKVGDLVLIEKQERSEAGSSRKMVSPYNGPMVIKTILPHDRYVVRDMDGSHRTTKTYQNIIAVDHMKPWIPDGGVSDVTEGDSDGDGRIPLPTDIESDNE